MLNNFEETQHAHKEFLAKRDEFTVEIRKKKNDDIVNSKRLRFALFSEQKDVTTNRMVLDVSTHKVSTDFLKLVDQFFTYCANPTSPELLKVIKSIRYLLSEDDSPYASVAIEAKILPQIAEYLDEEFSEFQELQNEAAWIITNITAGNSTQTEYVVQELDIIDRFFTRLQQPLSIELKKSIFWAFSNIIADKPSLYGKVCFERKLVPIIVKSLDDCLANQSLLKTMAWLIHQLCKTKIPFDDIAPLLAVIQKLLNNSEVKNEDDVDDVVYSSIYALDCIIKTREDSELKKNIISMGFAAKLIAMAKLEDFDIKYRCLRTIRVLLSVDQEQMKHLLNNGDLLKVLMENLENLRAAIRKEVCWSFSTICSEESKQIIEYPGLLEKLRAKLFTEENDVLIEILYCWRNMILSSNCYKVTEIVDMETMKGLIHVLGTNKSVGCLEVALETIREILDVGEQFCFVDSSENLFSTMLLNENGIKAIEQLQYHDDQQVCELADAIISTYFKTS